MWTCSALAEYAKHACDHDPTRDEQTTRPNKPDGLNARHANPGLTNAWNEMETPLPCGCAQ
eukprot:11217323-Lingulodinium_polyedra.AAC.1